MPIMTGFQMPSPQKLAKALQGYDPYWHPNKDPLEQFIQNIDPRLTALQGGFGKDNKQALISGRLGYNMPMENGNLNLGIGANAIRQNDYNDVGINKLDANYSWGDNAVGGSYNPQNDDFNIYYKRNL